MDILAGLNDKLASIERFYRTASEPFRETKEKIEAEEEPFEPPHIDPDAWNGEPFFLAEYEEAEEGLNLIGQASLCLVQSAFREYLDAFVTSSRRDQPAGRGNWFARYRQFFLETYGIDWGRGPIPPDRLEEINLARNDIQHTGEEFGMARYQSQGHALRFPGGLFLNEVDRELQRASAEWRVRISVTADTLNEAIRRVYAFCEFLEGHRLW